MGATRYLTSSASLRLSRSGAAVALPILAVEEFGNVGVGGMLVAAMLGPIVLTAPIIGVTLDRSRRPRALIACSGLVTGLALAVVSVVTPETIWLAVLVLMIAGAASPFYVGGFSSFVAEEIGDERKAYGYDALSFNLSAVAGPVLVAVAVPLSSSRVAMIVLAATTLLGAVATLGMRLTTPPASTPRGVLATIAAGTRHIVGHPPMALVTLTSALSAMGYGALPIAAVALAVERTDSAEGGGILVAVFALGGLVGALAETVRPARSKPQRVMLYAFLATGVLTLVAAIDVGPVWTALFIGLSGIFTATSTAAMLLLRKHLSPPSLRSQVFTVGSAIRASAGAIGVGLAGLVAGLGGTALLLGVAVCWAASAALMLAYPSDAPRLDLPPCTA